MRPRSTPGTVLPSGPWQFVHAQVQSLTILDIERRVGALRPWSDTQPREANDQHEHECRDA